MSDPGSWRHSRREGLALALADLWHDRRTTLVLVLTVASIIAPLLLLLGLKNGVVQTLRQDLLNDPRTLEIVVIGAHQLDRDWLDDLARRPDTGFVVPRTRSMNVTMDLLDEERRTVEAVDLIPTAAGDPLLARVPEGLPAPAHGGEVLMTEALAGRMGLAPGDPLSAIVRRFDDGRRDNAEVALTLIGIVPATVLAKEALFAHPDLLVASEDYRDGNRDTLTGDAVRKPMATGRDTFASARVYAASLEGVATLAEAMRAAGVRIRTQAEKIASVQAFDRVLGYIFRVIAVIGIGGCALALGGALWVNVDRKRRDLALLRLFGFGNGSVVLVPLVQSAAIAALGFALACLAYLAGAAAFNQVLGANLAGQGYVCRLGTQQVAAAAGAALLVALIAAVAAGIRAARIDPAECLREG
jgi:putative ABC transport system permease protein